MSWLRGGCCGGSDSCEEGDARNTSRVRPKNKEKEAPKKTVSPESDHRTRFELGWIAAVERAQELLAKGEWEPVLIADNVPDECLHEVDSHKYVYWTETVSADGRSLWEATLFAMATWGHEAGIEAKRSSYRKYAEENASTLFAGKADRKKWEITFDSGARDIEGYEVTEKGEAKTYSRIHPDARLEICYDGDLMATPAVFEFEISHRSLPQMAEHGGLLFKGWPDLYIYETMVVYPRQNKADGDARGGPFAAYYFLVCRNLDKPSTFRVEKFLSIGTARVRVQSGTRKAVLEQWRKFDVTSVCGKTLDDSFDADDAITDLNDEQRTALCDALENREPEAPAAVKDVLTFAVESTALYRPGPFRDNSGPLLVDLYQILLRVDKKREKIFTSSKRSAPEDWDTV